MLLALRADPLAVALERVELVVEDLLAVVEQPPDQRRLAVVDAAAGDEAQHLLLLLLGEPGANVGADELAVGVERQGHDQPFVIPAKAGIPLLLSKARRMDPRLREG